TRQRTTPFLWIEGVHTPIGTTWVGSNITDQRNVGLGQEGDKVLEMSSAVADGVERCHIFPSNVIYTRGHSAARLLPLPRIHLPRASSLYLLTSVLLHAPAVHNLPET